MRKRSIALLVLLLAVSASAQEPAPTEAAVAVEPPIEAPIEPPIIIDSEASESDLRSGITRFSSNVTIERGPMMVYADEGVVRQVDGEITEIVLTGEPTRWRDTLDDGSVVTGQAQRIQFDVAENIVTLTGSARLEHEQGRYTGDELVYDLDTESLAGRGTNGNRVRVVIEPEAVETDRPSPGTEGDANGDGDGDGDAEPDPAGDDGEAAEPDAPESEDRPVQR